MKWCPGWVVAVKVGEVELAGLGIDRNLGVGEEARLGCHALSKVSSKQLAPSSRHTVSAW